MKSASTNEVETLGADRKPGSDHKSKKRRSIRFGIGLYLVATFALFLASAIPNPLQDRLAYGNGIYPGMILFFAALALFRTLVVEGRVLEFSAMFAACFVIAPAVPGSLWFVVIKAVVTTWYMATTIRITNRVLARIAEEPGG
ncbi:MAG: hypothetical protein HND42_01555 [Armatimonadetes bacterium]|nr:hypothetical protein [Armatimonadota bacterium]NOG91917.1 hypothetical protein [Armatimonadota bacterium]